MSSVPFKCDRYGTSLLLVFTVGDKNKRGPSIFIPLQFLSTQYVFYCNHSAANLHKVGKKILFFVIRTSVDKIEKFMKTIDAYNLPKKC